MAPKKYTKWSDALLKTEAKKYTTRGDFLKYSSSAYMTAKRRGIMDDITKHMFDARFRWTEKMVKDEAAKYKTRSAFFKGSRSAYSAATRMDILEDVTEHMPRYAGKGQKRGPNIRTLEKQKKEARA